MKELISKSLTVDRIALLVSRFATQSCSLERDPDQHAHSLDTGQCGHAPFILLIPLPIFRDMLPNSKSIVLVPKFYIEIYLNFLKWITNSQVNN